MPDPTLLAAARILRQPAPKNLGDYLHRPAAWARDFIDWRTTDGLTGYQDEILTELVAHGRAAARGPHGLGKTTTNALAVLWFSTTRDHAGIDWKAITTAGAWRQLEKYLWPEIHKWARRIRWDAIGLPPFKDGRDLLDLSLTLTHGEAFAAASSNAALIEGAHADEVLYVFDESKAIDIAVWDAAEGAFSGATQGRKAYALAQSTPGEPNGRFYDIHARKPGLTDWWVRHVTLDEAIAAGRVAADWAENRRLQWGPDSAVYANRVLGEFHSSDEDGVIPLGWIEAANDRWRAWDDAGRPTIAGRRVIGVDVARFGADRTAISHRQGHVVVGIDRYSKQDTVGTAGRVAAKLGEPHARAVVDADGIGGGVVDMLRAQRHSVVAFVAQARCDRTDRTGEFGFANTRSAAWWSLREQLDPAFAPTLALPPDDDLTGDLTAPKWRIAANAKIVVESKDDIRPRLGRSPDAGDSVVYNCWISAGVVSHSDDLVAAYAAADGRGRDVREPSGLLAGYTDSDDDLVGGGWA